MIFQNTPRNETLFTSLISLRLKYHVQ